MRGLQQIHARTPPLPAAALDISLMFQELVEAQAELAVTKGELHKLMRRAVSEVAKENGRRMKRLNSTSRPRSAAKG